MCKVTYFHLHCFVSIQNHFIFISFYNLIRWGVHIILFGFFSGEKSVLYNNGFPVTQDEILKFIL